MSADRNHTIGVPRDELVRLYRLALACEECSGKGCVWRPSAVTCQSCKDIRANILELQCKDRSHLASMDLDTEPGERVVFSNPLNGWPGDKDAAKQLTIDGEYTLRRIDVGDSHTSISLEEVAGVFNSAQFRNVARPDEHSNVSQGDSR